MFLLEISMQHISFHYLILNILIFLFDSESQNVCILICLKNTAILRQALKNESSSKLKEVFSWCSNLPRWWQLKTRGTPTTEQREVQKWSPLWKTVSVPLYSPDLETRMLTGKDEAVGFRYMCNRPVSRPAPELMCWTCVEVHIFSPLFRKLWLTDTGVMNRVF